MIYRLCLAVLAAVVLPGAVWAQTTLTITGPDSIDETNTDLDFTYTVERSGDPFTASTEIALTLGTTDTDTDTLNYVELTGDAADVALGSATVTFAAGEDSQDFIVTVTGDDIDEDDQIFTITTSGGGSDLVHATKSTTIHDDEFLTWRVTASAPTVSEGGTVDLALVLNGETEGVRIYQVRFGGHISGTATGGGTDYTLPAQPTFLIIGNEQYYTRPTLGFSGPARGSSVSIDIADDALNEAPETLILNLSSASSFSSNLSINQATILAVSVTITDSNDIAVTIADPDPATVAEGATATFAVTLSNAAAAAVTVGYRIVGDVDSGDYADPNLGALQIAAGMTTGSIAITIAADGVAEGMETLRVELDDSRHAAPGAIANGATTSAEVMISSSAAAVHSVTVSGPNASVTEGGMAVFTFSLDTPASGDPNARTADLTAVFVLGGSVGASDYTAPDPLSVTFPSGDNSDQTVSVATMNDGLNEADETLVLTLTGVTDGTDAARFPGGAGARGSASATIADNDPITYRISGASDSGFVNTENGTVTVMVELSAASQGDVTIPYTLGGSATAGEDYAALPGTLRFPAGTTSGDIPIFSINDTLNEAEESIILTLSDMAVVGAGVGAVTRDTRENYYRSTHRFSDGDNISVSLLPPPDADPDATGTQVLEGSNAVFSVMLSGPSAGDVTVTVAVSDADAADFTAPATATVPAGMTSAPLPVSIANDGMDETGEMLTVTISAPTPGAGAGTVTLGTTVAQTVALADAAHAFAISGDAALVEGAAAATYTVTRTGPDIAPGSSIVVSWTYTPGATDRDAPADVAPTGGALTFAGSETEQTFSIAAVEDALDEPDETFTLGLSADFAVLISNGGVALGADITVTIGESDRPITLSLAAPGSDLTEGTAADFAVSFAEVITTTGAVMVDWAVAFPAVSTAEAADFAAEMQSGTAEIPAGASTANFQITAAADMLNESAETFSVTLSNPRGGGAIAAPMLSETPTAEASIAANDPVTVRIAGPGATVSEGGTADFTLSLALSDGTAAASGGALCVAFTTAVSSQQTPANTAENADIAVSDCTGAAVAVDAAGVASGGFNIPADSGSATLSIPVRLDTLNEGATPEVLTVTLTGITPAAGAGMAGVSAVSGEETASASLMNLNALRTLSVSAASATVDEDSVSAAGESAMAVFTITLAGADAPYDSFNAAWTLSSPGNTLTLPSAASAEAGGRSVGARDLGPGASLSGMVTFPAATSLATPATQTVSVPIAQDALNEGAEDLRLSIAVSQNAGGRPAGTPDSVPATLLSQPAATVQVLPSDAITVFLAPAAEGILTAGDDARYVMSFGTTTVNGQVVPIVPTTALTIPLTVSVGGASVAVDPVQVSAGSASVEVTVPATAIAAQTRSGDVMLSVAPQAPTGAPAGATARVATASDVAAEQGRGQTDAAAGPVMRQVSAWVLTIALPESGRSASEGETYIVTFALGGDLAEFSGLAIPWSIAARAADPGSQQASAADFGDGASADFPSGTVEFAAGEGSQTLEIAIFDDGTEEGTTPEGFTLTLGALGGASAAMTSVAAAPASEQLGAIALEIPALRVDLSIADVTALEGETARFVLTLSLGGGAAITSDVMVEYAVGAAGDTATRGEDYEAEAAGSITIPAGETSGQGSTAISIPLLRDGRLESRERFTVTITAATSALGSIRLTDSSATGIIGDDAEQEPRREERVGTLVALLDRQTALLATDAISARLSRQQTAAAPAQLSIANRNLLGASKSTAANGGSARATRGSAEVSAGAAQGAAPDIGLALYGAGGMSGAAATGGASLRGGGAGGYAGGGGAAIRGGYAGGADAFGGLGAGLAGGANMGSRTALPNLAQLLRGSRFTFAATNWTSGLSNLADGLQFWGSGGFADIDGDPQSGGDGLSYDGDNFAFFAGADRPVGQNLLAGFALGWAAGDLDFTDRDGDFQMQGTLSNDTISVHPYLGWQVTPTLNTWLVLGFGLGSVDISENEGSGAGRISRALNGGDSTMLMFSAGFSEQRQFAAADLKLRFAVTRVRSDVDSARFDDGALLPSARGRSIRVGGEAELSRRFAFANGIALRPFGSLRARFDSTGSTDAAARRGIEDAFDWGAGLQADWPALGLDGRFAFTRQLNETGRDEQRISATVNFDPGAKDRGLSVAVQSALAQSRTHTLGSAFAAGASANSAFGAGGSAFGAGGASAGSAVGGAFGNTFGAGAGGALGGASARQSLSGEIAYGMAFRLRQIGRSGLLTPYARFHLGRANTRWAAGLRLAELRSALQLGLEAALDRNSRNPANSTATTTTTTPGSSYDLLLTGRLHF